MTITSDVAGQLLTKKYRKEKIFGKPDPVNPLKAPGSVCHEQIDLLCVGTVTSPVVMTAGFA
jgi:hypothetical protein